MARAAPHTRWIQLKWRTKKRCVVMAHMAIRCAAVQSMLARSATTEFTVDPNRDQTSFRAVYTELHRATGNKSPRWHSNALSPVRSQRYPPPSSRSR